MDMHEVKGSKQVRHIGYDPATKTLRIRFHDRKNKAGETVTGGLYSYDAVPQHIWDVLFASAGDEKQSTGGIFGALVRKGGFKYVRMD